jgi:hypothetical protein
MTYTVENSEFVAWAEMETLFQVNKFHAVLCDPPYGIAFMGKEWDDPGGPVAFQAQAKAWGEAMLPLLYPGALVFMFAGTRMWHRLAAGMEDAGFHLWDTLMWLHGQGFPKAQDISKLIDKQHGRIGQSVVALKIKLRSLFEASGKTLKQIDIECGFRAANYLTLPAEGKKFDPWINVLPSSEKWSRIKTVIGCTSELDAELDAMFAVAEREIVGSFKKADSFGTAYVGGEYPETQIDITLPGSDISSPWFGHKTPQLKPAWEPVLCFRAPADGLKYAELAVKYGSGCLNIASGRIPAKDSQLAEKYASVKNAPPRQNNIFGSDTRPRSEQATEPNPGGRYPANVLLDEETASVLDEQSGNHPTARVEKPCPNPEITGHVWGTMQGNRGARGYSDDGGVSRFFYVAKANTSERNAGLDTKNNHPTVKPIELTRWLASLLLPPDSVKPRRLLVPFSGVASEMIGAIQAGWDEVVGIEMDAEYCKIAEARLKYHKSNGIAKKEK